MASLPRLPSGLPAGLDPEAFLAEHWQKQPLLLRAAFPGFRSPLTADELAGLACDPAVESRLVLGSPQGPWRLENGPFTTERFSELSERDWTLLAQDVDKHLPELARILEAFAFLPRWRIDDLMISYAPPGGSVGPHVDAYDVFLLQAEGQRRWQIDPEPGSLALREDSDIRVLDDFEPVREWVLEPGDMLYLPPGVAHHGIAESECMTWSIGFRAPDAPEMISDLAEYVASRQAEDRRYRDSDLHSHEAGAHISTQAVARLRAVLRDLLEMEDETLADWFGQFITEPKPWLRAESPESGTRLESDPGKYLSGGQALILRSDVLVAWREGADGQIRLFLDGEMELWPPDTKELARRLADCRRLVPEDHDLVVGGQARKLVTEWIMRGLLEPGDNE